MSQMSDNYKDFDQLLKAKEQSIENFVKKEI
jgi:hypothetical protein